MLGIAGLVLAVVAIVALIWRGWHMVVVSLVASLIVILANGMDVLSAINESYMGDMSAASSLGYMLMVGEGIPVDKASAEARLRMAADAGDAASAVT